MNTVPHIFFRLFHREWYETPDRYQPSSELLQVVRAVIPPTWRLYRNNKWYYVILDEINIPRQGWKIHISATPVNCEEVLQAVATICTERETPFKFTLDRFYVTLTTSKIWPREAAGKFITIYPKDKQDFRELLEVLYLPLQRFTGPYILSDRRFKDSRVIYYRYGGIDDFSVLSYRGEKQHMLVSPDGDLVRDQRAPYWNPPSWAIDDLYDSDTEKGNATEPVLKEGRYLIRQVLRFSVSGGVYLAIDQETGNTVVIKEARPATAFDAENHDAIDRLRKEYRLLQKLQDTGITPLPIDLFQDWEHLFLVEEYVPGPDLAIYVVSSNPLFSPYPVEQQKKVVYVDKLRMLWTKLAQGIALIHSRGIVYGDLSIKNVIVSNENAGEIRIIDLEAAWEEGVDAPTQLATPGFINPNQKGKRSQEDDFYALGAVMLGTLFTMNPLLDVDPSAKERFTRELGIELGVPEQIQSLIKQCLSENASERPAPRQVVEVINQAPTLPCISARTPLSQREIHQILPEITSYIRASADVQRKDRLFPGDFLGFLTNSMSIAYGATGVAYALSKIDGEVSQSIQSWLLEQFVNQADYTPGLYIGSAGISWAFWELGFHTISLQIMRSIDNHPLLWDVADVFYGAAGYGLACLHLYLETKGQEWLDRAVEVGEWLLVSKKEDEKRGFYWPDKEGRTHLGYTRGASGIALYLLYLSLVTSEQQFLEIGQRALAFDLSFLERTRDGILSIPRGVVGSFESVISHYWLNGSAGVATTLLRYWAYTKNPHDFALLEQLAPDTFRKYTVHPNLFQGLSGLGNFLLDAYDFTGDKGYLDRAYEAAKSVLLYQVQRPEGVAFPGDQLLRLSTDFGTGSAGIALFLHRLAHADQRIGNFNFTLDRLLWDRSGQDILVPVSRDQEKYV